MDAKAFAPLAQPSVSDEERDDDDQYCSCGADLVWADCHMIDCEDGEYDEHDYDAINYAPGSYMPCGECGGNGGWMVCPDPDRHRRLA